MLVRFVSITGELTHEPFRMDEWREVEEKKTTVRKIVLIKPNTTGSPVHATSYKAIIAAIARLEL